MRLVLLGAGRIEMIRITSREPEPPSAEHIRVSGGIFRDMTPNDLDMARFLLQRVEVLGHSSG